MTAPHVREAVTGYLASLKDRGLLLSRPVRLDGLTDEEIDEVLPQAMGLVRPGRVAVLSDVTAEHLSRIDSDRATRYRNAIDADHEGFVLFVPQDKTPESSLNEPAFLVVTRESLFRSALARRRRELDLSAADVEGIRRISRFGQSESLFAFLWAWDEATGAIDPLASYSFLGLLAHSGLGGSVDSILERLRRNADAADLIVKPGLSPTRLLDELASAVDLDTADFREEVLDLARWWGTAHTQAPPPAIDFASWPLRSAMDAIEIQFEPDLRRPPHKGWKDQAGEIWVDKALPSATFEWLPDRVPSDVRYSVQLVEATSQQVVVAAIGGKSGRPKRSVKWSSVLKGEALLAELRSLDPGGEEGGYSLQLRLAVTRNHATLKEYDSLPFVAIVADSPDEVPSLSSPTLYHAMYQFHSEQRAESPRVVSVTAEGVLRLESDNGRVREAAVDVSEPLLEVERRILASPSAIGPYVVRQPEAGTAPALQVSEGSSILAADLPEEFRTARTRLFEAIGLAGPLEALQWREEPLRSLALGYVDAFRSAVSRFANHAENAGAVAAEDQLRCAALMSADTVKVMVRDDQDEIPVILIPPIHPVSLAWLIDFADLVWHWTRGPFEGDRKPGYRAVIESMSVGPRSMALATLEPGSATPRWWGYGGNLSGTWQCFVPIGPDQDVRSRGWADALLGTLELPSRPIGAALADARRVGSRLKKYAVLHPYVNQMAVAALTSGDGLDVLEALKAIDERAGTPAGSVSVRDLRYEVTVIGPRSPGLGRALDEMVADPGDARWSRYATAILDNPETVLAPGFAYARRPIDPGGAFWEDVRQQLTDLGSHGVHVALLGPMLTAEVSAAPSGTTGLNRSGLAAQPTTTIITPVQQRSAYQGDWVLTIGAGPNPRSYAETAVAGLARALALAHGDASPDVEVGLAVRLAGPMASVLRKIHQISDWVVIADPLFSIELMDRCRRKGHDTVMLDYTPEFDPYPGGRVVVTTNSIGDVEQIAGQALGHGEKLSAVLSSVSARLLLALANPTRQVVGGLTGLALTRAFVAQLLPGALSCQ